MADTTAMRVLDNLVREELPSTLYESLPELSPTYKYIENTSMDVTRNGVGRAWQVNHLYATGVAGLMQNADPMGPGMEDTTYMPMVNVLNESGLAPFPTASQAPHVSEIRRTLSLHMSTGNFSIPLTWMQADALDASQIAQVARDVKAVGEMRAHSEACSFFMASNNTLGQIENYSAAGAANGYFTFTVKAGTGRTQYLRPGMAVDIVADSSGTVQWGAATDSTDVRNYVSNVHINLVVASVDYLAGTITVVSTNGTVPTTFTQNVVNSDWVILRNCNTSGREMRTWGLNDWIASSGTILQRSDYTTLGTEGLNLTNFPQFKSVVAAVSGPLTDSVLNRYIGGYLEAYLGNSLDTIVTTMGVTMKYLEQPNLYNNRMFYDRTGKALSSIGGWDEVGFHFNGKKFNWITTPLCLQETLYGLKMGGGNIKRYSPPKIGGTDARVGSELEFLGPMFGTGIFLPGRASTGAVQMLAEAPFWQYVLVAPIDVRAVKLTGLTEATLG